MPKRHSHGSNGATESTLDFSHIARNFRRPERRCPHPKPSQLNESKADTNSRFLDFVLITTGWPGLELIERHVDVNCIQGNRVWDACCTFALGGHQDVLILTAKSSRVPQSSTTMVRDLY